MYSKHHFLMYLKLENLQKFLIADAKIKELSMEVQNLENKNYFKFIFKLGPLSFDTKIGSSVLISLVQLIFSPGQ